VLVGGFRYVNSFVFVALVQCVSGNGGGVSLLSKLDCFIQKKLKIIVAEKYKEEVRIEPAAKQSVNVQLNPTG
jgi:hypothetical protein